MNPPKVDIALTVEQLAANVEALRKRDEAIAEAAKQDAVARSYAGTNNTSYVVYYPPVYHFGGIANGTPACRVSLGENRVVILDGQPIAVKARGYAIFQLLLAAPLGDYVSLDSHGLRTRDVDALPKALRDVIDSQPGVGSRIGREWLC